MHKWGRTPKVGSAGATPPWDRRHGWPPKNKSLQHMCQPCRTWSFYLERCKHKQREPKPCGALGGRHGWPQETHPSPRVNFSDPDCSALKSVRTKRRNPRNGEPEPPLWWGRCWPPRNVPLTHTCYPAEFGRSRSNGTSVIKEMRLKNWSLASAFLGHSRWSEATRIDQ